MTLRNLSFNGRRTSWLGALAAGALAACGQAPINQGGLTFVGLVAGYLLFTRAQTAGQGFRIGWLFGAGYFAVALHWIVEPFFVDVAATGWMAPFALFFMASGVALFWGVGFAVAQRLAKSPLGWAAAMALAELLRGYVLTGFPWALPAHSLVNSVAAQSVAWIGAYGLTFLLLLAAGFVGSLLDNQTRLPALALGALVVGLSVVPMPGPTPTTDGPKVRLIQPNAPQVEKWNPKHIETFFDRQLDLTYQGEVPDVVIWPETAVATPIPMADERFERMIAAARGATVVTGIQRRDGSLTYNSLVVLDEEVSPVAIYDKHHLVPFGEYMPLGDWLAGYGLRGLAAEDGAGYARGPGPITLDIPRLGRALPLICYEVVFPQDLRTSLRPDVLVQITNDAWFGNFSGPYQHLAQARFRAIEQGLPMLRVANTGVSAAIDSKGRIIDSLPLGQAGRLDVILPPPGPETVYSRNGDTIILTLLLVLLVFSFLRTYINTD